MSAWWSWLLAALSLVSTTLIGRKITAGWAVAALSQVVWLAYSVLTEQYGFAASSVVYFVIQVHSFVRWTRDDRARLRQCDAIRTVETLEREDAVVVNSEPT